jgi:hypothetical protein
VQRLRCNFAARRMLGGALNRKEITWGVRSNAPTAEGRISKPGSKTVIRKILFAATCVASVLFANCATAQNNSLAAYQSEYRQLQISAQNCIAQDARWAEQSQRLAPQGVIVPLPACHNYDAQRIARMAELEAVIGQMSGTSTATPCERNWLPGCERFQRR